MMYGSPDLLKDELPDVPLSITLFLRGCHVVGRSGQDNFVFL